MGRLEPHYLSPLASVRAMAHSVSGESLPSQYRPSVSRGIRTTPEHSTTPQRRDRLGRGFWPPNWVQFRRQEKGTIAIAYFGLTLLIPLVRDFYGRKPSTVSCRVLAHGSLLLSTAENEVGEGVAYLKSVCATLDARRMPRSNLQRSASVVDRDGGPLTSRRQAESNIL